MNPALKSKVSDGTTQCFTCERIIPKGMEYGAFHLSGLDLATCTVCDDFNSRLLKLNPPGSFNNSAIHRQAELDIMAEWREATSQEFS